MKIIIRLSISLVVLYAVSTTSCKKVAYDNCKENKLPIANAGADQTITLPKVSHVTKLLLQ
jgi:hypothetical protein